MHNQGGYIQGPQGPAGQVARPQQQQGQAQQQAQVQPSPQQHHVLPSPSQFSPFMMIHNPQGQFVPGAHFMMPQHIPAAQLPQLPAQYMNPQQDQACLLVIPMHFNGRDLSYTMQTGILVPSGTSTFHGGFHIIHQSHFPQPHQMQQQQQQPHPQQMSNGFGQGQQQGTVGSPGGSSGFGDAVSTSSSRENATHTSPVNAGSNNVVNHAVNMDPRAVMYPYPNQSLSYTVAPGMPMHPGFVPQMQMHPQIMNAYGGQQPPVHAISQSNENVQGAGHTPDEHGERQQPVQEMANGVQEAEHRSGSSAQSRSTSYSSNMDIENNAGHIGAENASAAEPNAQDDHLRRSRTPSPEDVTLRGSVDETKEGMSNGEVGHQHDSFPYQDELDNSGYDENTNRQETPGHASAYAEHRAEALSPSKVRPGSQGVASPLHQMNPTSASALGGNVRSNTDSPLSTRSTNSPHTLTASHNQTEQPKSASETPRAESPVTPTVVDNTPKSWAAITQGGPKGTFPASANQKPGARPPVAARPEPPRPAGSGGSSGPKGAGNYQSNEDGYGGGYRNGGNGGQRSAGSGSGGQERPYEFPRLQTVEADAFPDAQQVYIRDIPTSVTSTSMHNAMKAFGNVVDVRLRYHLDRKTRFCFILFDHRSAVDRLVEKGTVIVDGKTLDVQKKGITPLHSATYSYRNSGNNRR